MRIEDRRAPIVLLIGYDGGAASDVLEPDSRFEMRRVTSFSDARQALTRVAPEAIVLALREPTPQHATELRSLLANRPVPALVLSEPVDDTTITAFFKAGAGGYLLRADVLRLPQALRELLAGGVPMSNAVSQLVLGRARRSSAKMAAVRIGQPAPAELVTERQIEILKLLTNGHSYEDIANALGLSVNTVRSHVRAIYERLGVSTKVEAVITAMDLGLIDRRFPA